MAKNTTTSKASNTTSTNAGITHAQSSTTSRNATNESNMQSKNKTTSKATNGSNAGSNLTEKESTNARNCHDSYSSSKAEY